jgi:hypothetical protein
MARNKQDGSAPLRFEHSITLAAQRFGWGFDVKVAIPDAWRYETSLVLLFATYIATRSTI